MIKNYILSASILFFTTTAVFAQQRCHTTEYMEELYQVNPSMQYRQQQYQLQQEKAKSKLASSQATFKTAITVPVVVHVVYQNQAENISDAEVLSAIAALNADFSATNTDIGNVPSAFQNAVGNPNIQFCMAQVDPAGNATNGINRVQTTQTTFSTNDVVKKTAQGGVDAWDVTQYFNIWVCDLGTGLLGYGQFPNSSLSNTYGVVCNYKYFGTVDAQAPFNKGRTLTHEIGHCLNLRHIWGDATCGNDFHNDTPEASGPNYGCPSFPKTSQCSNGPNGEMFMNYMDYVDDACMVMFSNDQSATMVNVLSTSPWNVLQNSTVCNSSGGGGQTSPSTDAAITEVISPSSNVETCGSTIQPVIRLASNGTINLTSATIMYQIGTNSAQQFNWTGNLSTGTSEVVTLPSISSPNGTNVLTVSVSNANGGNSDIDASNDELFASYSLANPAGVSLPFQEDFENSFPPQNWEIINGDAGLTWAQTSNSATSGSKSAYRNNYDGQDNGQVDDMITPGINLSAGNNPMLSFDIAYQLYTDPASNSFSDTLVVSISGDCGNTWTDVYKKSGEDLTTSSPTFSDQAFYPTSNEWRTESISLANFSNLDNAKVRFRNISDWENNLYIDRIDISTSTGSSSLNNEFGSISFFPNPFSDELNIQSNELITQIQIFNAMGALVESIAIQNQSIVKVDMAKLTKGIYTVKTVASNNKSIVSKVVKN